MAEQRQKKALEVGDTGLHRQGGYIYEEFLRELQGDRAIKVYKEMSSNDAMVFAILYAIRVLIRNVSWRVDPVSAEAADIEAAEFLESCMHDMEFTWNATIDEILSMLVYGWSWHEKVYKRRLGQTRNPETNSKYNDGRIGWRKLPIRSQDTRLEWVFAENGDVTAMIQQSPVDYQLKTIPRTKSLHFRTTTYKNNPEGNSVLRGAYRAWYYKRQLENIEGIGVERDLAGLPVAWIPPDIMNSNKPEDKQVVAAFKKMVRNVRRDEQEGILMPLAYDDAGHKAYDFTLLSSGGSRQLNTNEIINRYNRDIAMTVLADFILLGHEKVGSFALSSSKTDLFAASLGAYLDVIETEFNKDAVTELFAVNGMTVEKLPQIKHGDIETVDLAELGEFISKTSGAGMELFPDDGLENYIRDQAGWPKKKEDDILDDNPLSYPGGDIGGNSFSDLETSKIEVASTVELVKSVARGEIPRESAVNILQTAYKVDSTTADKILGPAGRGFKTNEPKTQ